jgi:hypothetical protein
MQLFEFEMFTIFEAYDMFEYQHITIINLVDML